MAVLITSMAIISLLKERGYSVEDEHKLNATVSHENSSYSDYAYSIIVSDCAAEILGEIGLNYTHSPYSEYMDYFEFLKKMLPENKHE
jgi:hypothetical protein